MRRSGSCIRVLCALAVFVASAFGCAAQDGPRATLRLLDLAGKPIDPLAGDAARARVFLFAATDCPISNRYAPEVRRLHEKFAQRGVSFFLVYPDPDTDADAIRGHHAEYGYTMPALQCSRPTASWSTGAGSTTGTSPSARSARNRRRATWKTPWRRRWPAGRSLALRRRPSAALSRRWTKDAPIVFGHCSRALIPTAW